MKEKNFSPMKMFAPMASFPFFIVYFITLRRMASEYDSFQWGGMLWFSDLSIADPFMILPIVSALGMIATFELAQNSRLPSQQAMMSSQVMTKYARWLVRGLAFAAIPMTMNMPAVSDLFF
jgi:YidC/Oxa1 family membrane protein insertase